jgi:hypothetical protein
MLFVAMIVHRLANRLPFGYADCSKYSECRALSMTSAIPGVLPKSQSWLGRLQQESDGDANAVRPLAFEPHNRAKEFSMGRDFVAIGKCNHQAHPDQIMRHGRSEIYAIPREINYLAHVFDLRKPGVKRPNVERQRNLQPLSAAAISGRFFGSPG